MLPLARQPLPEARACRSAKDVDLAFRRVLDVKDSHHLPVAAIIRALLAPILIPPPPLPILCRGRRGHKRVAPSTLPHVDDPHLGRRHRDAALRGIMLRRDGGHPL